MRRDFTNVDDIVEGIARLMAMAPVTGQRVTGKGVADSLSAVRVVNIAGGPPVGLLDFISTIEAAVGQTAFRTRLPMQTGDLTKPSPTRRFSRRPPA